LPTYSIDKTGLLGALNDVELDNDPGVRGDSAGTAPVVTDLPPFPANPPASQAPPRIWRFNVAMDALRGLNSLFYWNNCSLRQGKLRSDGAYVGAPGMSGNDGVLKYLCGDDDPGNYSRQNFSLNGKGATRAQGESSKGDSGQTQGVLITMWAKTSWHHDDGIRSQAFYFRKQGRVQAAVCESGSGTSAAGQTPYETMWTTSGSGDRSSDLSLVMEPEVAGGDWSETDSPLYLHGGTAGVPSVRRNRYIPQTSPPQPNPQYRPESTAYRIQPFRWQYVGARLYFQRNRSASHNAEPEGSNFWNPSVYAVKSGFWNPNLVNRILDASGNPIKVSTACLRYRVRYRYPVDQLADPGSGTAASNLHHADPSQHYLLDTPVFDDISITYVTRPRILDYKEVLE